MTLITFAACGAALVAGCGVGADPTSEADTTTVSPLVVDVNAAFYDTSTACTVGGTTMHCCPVGNAMVGIHVDRNTFKCAPLKQPGGTRSIDFGTVRNDMHVCPWGQVMVGLHVDLNQLACQTVTDGIAGEHVDTATSDSFPMHTCSNGSGPWAASAMTGIRVDRNAYVPTFRPMLPAFGIQQIGF